VPTVRLGRRGGCPARPHDRPLRQGAAAARACGFAAHRERAKRCLAALANLRALGREGLAAHPCVGSDRVDFVLPGCAVFAAITRLWPASRVIVADRGLREGMLLRMIRADRSSRTSRRVPRPPA
jgi:exopolyphosphatase/pppGpp-phosphohydrolase